MSAGIFANKTMVFVFVHVCGEFIARPISSKKCFAWFSLNYRELHFPYSPSPLKPRSYKSRSRIQESVIPCYFEFPPGLFIFHQFGLLRILVILSFVSAFERRASL
jgi:hypothetical protein